MSGEPFLVVSADNSLVVVIGGSSPVAARGLLIAMLLFTAPALHLGSVVGAYGLSSPVAPGIRSASPALYGGSSTTGPPGTSEDFHLKRLLTGSALSPLILREVNTHPLRENLCSKASREFDGKCCSK